MADSEDETRDRDNKKPLDHDKEIDMDDYEYCADAYTKDEMSGLFQNFPDLTSFAPDDITRAVENIAVPDQDFNIEAIAFDDALSKGFVPALNEDAARLFTGSERILQKLCVQEL